MSEIFLQHTQALRDNFEASNLETSDKAQAKEILDELDSMFRSGLATKAVTAVMLSILPPLPSNAATLSALTAHTSN
jgi:hypothetical protein